LAPWEGKKIFLVAATLRPETMFGQTNCYILPKGKYGLYEMKNGDLFVMSARAAKNCAYQELTPVDREYPCLAEILGSEFIGKRVKAPLSSYGTVFILPMTSIKMTKGTGIVTSVPSDSPDDFAMLRDLQNDAKLRAELKVDEAWVKDFKPVPIIDIEGMGDLCAEHACNEFKVKTHKDEKKLLEAKDKCYQLGFTKGVMKVGPVGMKVEAAKVQIKQEMIAAGLAVNYYEPEKQVVSRTGDDCIVALCDQWLNDYGEESWKNAVKAHVKSDNFETYNPKTKHEFVAILDWLKEWGCSRTTGLGTKVPWDDQFVIESLSDSTIYMAYYTIAGLLQGPDNLDGKKVGPSGIPAEAMSIEAFNYIFLDAPYDASI